MALTNLDAEKLLEAALSRGKTLTISCNNGDKVTVGKSTSTGTGFEALRWGKSRLALPSGKPIAWGPRPQDVSYAVVQHCGRGNVNQALSKVASQHMSDLKTQLIKLGSTNPELRPHIREILKKTSSNREVLSSSIKTAGAVDFFVFMKGTDAKRLFREAQEDAEDEARWEAEDEGEEYEGGYSGTIAEKPGFRIMGQAETLRDAQQMADRMIDKNDKWGPAFAIEVGKGGRTEGFYFFGWASS